MNWITNTPTREEQIRQVADILFCNTETGQLSIEKCYELAEKIVTKEGANLKEGETVTDCHQLDMQTFAKEMSDNIFTLPSSETKNTEESPLQWEYTIARHFAKWGAEHLKK